MSKNMRKKNTQKQLKFKQKQKKLINFKYTLRNYFKHVMKKTIRNE